MPNRELLEDGHVNESLTLRLPDGRELSYAEYGDPDGVAGFYFHGHPGSRFEAQLAHDAASGQGIRIIALDRPGYGRSTHLPARRLLDWPADVAAAADQLGLERFSVLGASGGGPYALACGYALPQRVTTVGVVSGVGPYGAPGVTKGMRWQNRVGFQLSARIPALARFLMWSMARQVRRNPERVVEAIGRAMSGADAEAVRRPEVQDLLAKVLTEAFRQGSRGPAQDIVLLGRPWHFELRDVHVPVLLWQGEADVLVPPAMGRYMEAHLSSCIARYFPGEGHLLVLHHLPEVLAAVHDQVGG